MSNQRFIGSSIPNLTGPAFKAAEPAQAIQDVSARPPGRLSTAVHQLYLASSHADQRIKELGDVIEHLAGPSAEAACGSIGEALSAVGTMTEIELLASRLVKQMEVIGQRLQALTAQVG